MDKYGISKVKAIVEGGKERYHSVFEGLKQTSDADYVLIHDGARPFVNQEIIRQLHAGGAGISGMCCWHAGERYH